MDKTSKLRPADLLTITFIGILLGITVIFHSVIPRAVPLIITYLLLLAAQFAAFALRNRNGFLRFLYDLILPVTGVIILFDSLEWVVHYVNPKDIDPLLIRLDYMIFDGNPTVMLEKVMSPLLTDILQVAYSSYYFLPVILGILLLKDGQKEEFNKTLFLTLFCFYLSYIGYLLMPAIGPRFTLNHMQDRQLHGLFIAEPLQHFLDRLEGIKRDAFPSGHTGVALTVLYLSYRFKRRLFWIFLPVVTALIFSTVYCRYHYVVDVIAGFGLTFLTITAGEKLLARLSRPSEQ